MLQTTRLTIGQESILTKLRLADLPPAPLGRKGWPWTEESPSLPVTMPGLNSWPRISVITPSYNQGRFLEETIRSVLLQGYPNFEFLIMDGGSNDDSVEIIRKYQPWLTYWVSEKDHGQSHAINKGWAKATGSILAWLNSDDVYLPGTLSKAASVFEHKPESQLIYGSALFTNAESQIVGQFPGQPLQSNVYRMQYWKGWNIPQPTMFFRRQLVDDYGPLDETYHYSLDYEWLIRVSQHVEFTCINETLATYRLHNESKTGDWEVTKERFFKESRRANRKYAPLWSPKSWRLRASEFLYYGRNFLRRLAMRR
jgi:glycosyltransferase involved in cell wall biosynthesis